MSRKMKIKLKPEKAKIKLKSGDDSPLLPEAQMQALLAATLARAVPSELDHRALEGGQVDASARTLLDESTAMAPEAAK